MKKKSFIPIALLAMLSYSQYATAQSATPPKKVAIAQISTKELVKLTAAVESNPNNAEAHNELIKAIGIENPDLVKIYEKWMTKHPKSEIYPYTLGSAMSDKELPSAKKYLLKAVELNPKNSQAYSQLSIDAQRWGQNDEALKYMKNAHLASPDDPSYMFYYSRMLKDFDVNEFRKLTSELVSKFPTQERGAQALYWVAMEADSPAEKIKGLEYLREKYAPGKFVWSGAAMPELWSAYLAMDPDKAMNMANEFKSDKAWESIITANQQFKEMKKLSAEGKYAEALAMLNAIKSPRSASIGDLLTIEKAELLSKSGKPKQAVDTLIVHYAKYPSGTLETELAKQGKLASMTTNEIDTKVRAIRYANVAKALPFELGRYDSNSKLNLADLKGKVVLLTFWFPGCGPCRGEFPHFQQVVDKYKDKDVVYLGINMFADQDPYVIPFMQNTKYSFIPLRGNEKVGVDYKVVGMPDNFIIDKKGNIVFENFRTNGSNQRSLELMLDELLADKS